MALDTINEDGENHLIIPIGMVTLDEDNKKVHTDQIDYNTFAKTKRFKKGVDIEKSYELMVLPHYSLVITLMKKAVQKPGFIIAKNLNGLH